MEVKLYVWDNLVCGSSGYGLVVALASSLEEAQEQILKQLYLPDKPIAWSDYAIKPLNAPFAIIGGG